MRGLADKVSELGERLERLERLMTAGETRRPLFVASMNAPEAHHQPQGPSCESFQLMSSM